MIISNGTTNSNHHNAIMERNNSSSVLTADNTTNNTTYHHHHPAANTNHNVGVVSPLIYNNQDSHHHHHHHDPNHYISAAPPLSATALRTVSSCSSIGFGHNPISPTTTQRMEDMSTTTNYNWSASSNRSSSDHRPTFLRPTRASFPYMTTTTTPKHERHLQPDTHDAPPPSASLPSSAHKKQRPNSYIAPRHIPDTYTSRVGTNQQSGSTITAAGDSSLMPPPPTNRVPFRRQLSSGKIEAFLSGSTATMDAGFNNSNSSNMMDVDTRSGHHHHNKTMDASSQQQQQQQRPRSMSF